VAIGTGGPPNESDLNVGDTEGRIREHGPDYYLASEREKIRGRLAQILVWAVVGATAGSLLLLAIGRITVADVPTVAGVATPLAGIAGAAIGFYFGGDERRKG
jgi:hypothetical protein